MKHSTPEESVVRHLAKVLILLGATFLAGHVTRSAAAAEPAEQVLFVCERGNVKSLMAAAYFNQLAAERNLSLRAISRGVAPDSTSVPPAIIAGLQGEGIQVNDYRPRAVQHDDAARSSHVVTIGTDLPPAAKPAGATVEQWNDVPAASTNYAAARDSLRAHVRDLVERLSRPSGRK
jgi:arsenate reductase (thioredoxin)